MLNLQKLLPQAGKKPLEEGCLFMQNQHFTANCAIIFTKYYFVREISCNFAANSD
jgi:hypothetical protein